MLRGFSWVLVGVSGVGWESSGVPMGWSWGLQNSRKASTESAPNPPYESLTTRGIVTGTIYIFCRPRIFQRNYCYFKTIFIKPSIHKTFTTNEGSTPKSSIFVGVFLINHPFWEPPFSGNPHLMIFWMIFQGIGLRLPVKKKKPKEGNKSPVTRSWPCFGLW